MHKNRDKNVIYFDSQTKSKDFYAKDIDRSLVKILKEHESDLRRFINKRLINDEDKDDLLQDIFIRLATQKNLEERLSRGPEKTKAYLIVTASNLIRDKYRRKKIREDSNEKVISNQKQFVLNKTPENITECDEILKLIDKVLENLPLICRQAFVLSRYHGMNYREVGLQLNISASMVEKHNAKALMALRVAFALTEEKS